MSGDATVRGAAAPDMVGAEQHMLERLHARELAVRFAFGAAVSASAGLVGLVAGRSTGGLFLAFPAIFPAALTLVEKKEGTSKAVSESRGAVLGAVGLVVFACVVLALVVRIPGVLALLIATLAWLLTAVGLYVIGASRRALRVPRTT